MKKVSRKSVSMIKIFMVLAAFMVALPLTAGVSQAAGPDWALGFPKLAQKNALLQWNPVKGATEYKVYKGEQKGKGKLVSTVKVNRYIDKDIPAGKTFYYSVSAVVGGSEGARSAEAAVKTAAEKVFVALKTPTLQPGHVKDLPDGKVSVGIRWEGAAGTDLVGVNVYRSKAKGKDYALIGSSGSDMFEDKDVQRGETYYYVTTSVDSQFNETKYSNEVAVNVPSLKEAVKGPEGKQAARVESTTMRPAKLLFRVPSEEDTRGKGSEESVLGSPQDVAVDEAVGHIYVTSFMYGGVLVYDMEGRLQFGIRKDGVGGNVKFSAIKGIALGKNGNIYVVDLNSPDIDIFDFTGRHLSTITVDVGGPKARNWGVAVDQDDNIYVTDGVTNSVQVLNSRGDRLYEVRGARTEEEAKRDRNKQLFNGPGFITLTKDGGFVFLDGGWVKLMEYGKGGKFRKSISKRGNSAGELYYPFGVTTGNKGEILVASSTTPNIQAFSTAGKFLYALCNEKCNGPIDANNIRGICIDSKDRIYVTEGFSNRVSVYQIEERTVEVTPQ